MFDIQHLWAAFLAGLQHLPTTLFLTFSSLSIGIIFGLFIALVRYFKVPLLGRLFQILIIILRGVPILLLLLAGYLFTSEWVNYLAEKYSWGISFEDVNAVFIALFAYVIFATVQASEVLRGALQAIDQGQFDAAYSIGMTRRQMIRRIIVPQIFPTALPMIGNLTISLLKATSLASLITVVDVLMGSLITANANYRFLESYVAAALIYWLLAIMIEQVTRLLENKQRFQVKEA